MAIGFVLVAFFKRRLWQMTYLRLLLLAVAFYTLTLFVKNFQGYLYSGEAVAIHGRYLVPMYPVLYAMLALGFVWLFRRMKRSWLQPLLVVLALVTFLQGAGLVGWLYRSEPSWYWTQDTHAPVYYINRSAHDVLHRLIIQ